jgi:hypothetical protein
MLILVSSFIIKVRTWRHDYSRAKAKELALPRRSILDGRDPKIGVG